MVREGGKTHIKKLQQSIATLPVRHDDELIKLSAAETNGKETQRQMINIPIVSDLCVMSDGTETDRLTVFQISYIHTYPAPRTFTCL